MSELLPLEKQRAKGLTVAKQERSERTRRKLVRAAAELFDRHGFAKATLDDISRAAGVTKGALYFHFTSKDELADAVQAHGRDMLNELVANLREQGKSPLQTLIDITHVLTRWLRDDPEVRASFRITRECVGRQPPVADFYLVWISAAWALLFQAREAQDLRDDLVGPAAETLVAAATTVVEVMSYTGMPHDEVAERLAAMWSLVLPNLVPEGMEAEFRSTAPEKLACAGARTPLG